MTAQRATRLTLRTFKHKKRKVSNVTDITDHMPTVLVSINSKEKSQPKQNALYKRRHTDDNINIFKSNLSKTNWQNVLINGNANDDYNAVVKKFNDLYDECMMNVSP